MRNGKWKLSGGSLGGDWRKQFYKKGKEAEEMEMRWKVFIGFFKA